MHVAHEPVHDVRRRDADPAETVRANRSWWDDEAPDYYAEHGRFLGDDRFVWGPEGLDEADAGLLGAVAGRRVLEVGAGAGQCSRWLARQGAVVAATDLSIGMLRQGQDIERRLPDVHVPLVQADAGRLPFADGSFDLACSAYGAVPFVADSAGLMREVARVVRPGGRWVFSVSHPLRWALPDDPGEAGLVVGSSYFDRTPYVEEGERGAAVYVEHHRTLGDRVRELVAAGFVLDDLVEPEWPDTNDQVWGGWSPLRGRLIPGTAIFVCHRSG
ncbi:MAG: class I SAM-dependent methyltransferase [Angustibacter sp.]